MPGKDYYKTLELSRDATDSQIKKAYKRLALKYHPDKNPDDRDGAEAKFKEVSEAYAVLSDEKKKAIYDRVGEAGLNGAADQQRDPDDDGSHGFAGFQQGQSFSNADAARVFQAFFGGADPFGGGARGGARRGGGGGGGFHTMFQSMGGMGGGMPFSMGGMGGMPDEMDEVAPPLQEVTYGCTLEEIANGTKKKLNVTRKRQRGAEDGKKLFEIDVKPGYKAGTKVTFENEGDFMPQYNRNADLVFRLEEKPHPKFTRHGSDLHCKVTIELRDALLGTVINVPTLYGKTVPVTLSGVTSSGKKYRVNGEGMPDRKNSNAKGDLYVEVIVKMPTKLTEEQKQLIAKAFPE